MLFLSIGLCDDAAISRKLNYIEKEAKCQRQIVQNMIYRVIG